MRKNNILKLSDYELDRKVKLEGTDFDRRRVCNNKDIKKFTKYYNKGYSYKDIAEKFNYSTFIIRYNIDEEYKRKVNSLRKYYAVTSKPNYKDRVTYKRSLVAEGKLKTK